jgi:DNA-binding protein HU-beta
MELNVERRRSEKASRGLKIIFSQSLDRNGLTGILSLHSKNTGVGFSHVSLFEEEETMIKLDIVNQVADKTGVPKQKAEQVVDSLFNAMKEALAKGSRIELRGFGVFIVKPRKRGVGRNPRTGMEVPIPAGKTIRFKPGKELTEKAVKEES